MQVCMTELLAQIVEEVGPISQESIELLLEQFEKVMDCFSDLFVDFAPADPKV